MKTSVIGILFIAALAVVLYLGITLSGSGSLGEVFGESKQEVRISFDQVAGLKKRDEVTVSGITVGQVSNLELQTDGRVLVTCMIDPSAKVFKNAEAEIVSINALGGRAVAILPGLRSEGVYDGNEPLQGLYVPDFLTAAGKAMSKVEEALDKIIDVVDDVKVVSQDMRDGKGAAGMLISDSEVRDELKDSIHKVNETMNSVQSAAEGIDLAVKAMNNGKGALHHVIYNEETGKDLTTGIAAGKETLENLKEASEDIAEITEKANNGEGLIPTMLNDKELTADTRRLLKAAADAADSVKETFVEAHVLVKGVNEGEGTMGRLFNDDVLYNDILRTVNTLQASFEDLREQAPVTTFASVIFQVFQ